MYLPQGACTWVMTWVDYETESFVDEEVPLEINFKGAPDLSKLTAVDRAKACIDWFNDTREKGDSERRLIKVDKVVRQTEWKE